MEELIKKAELGKPEAQYQLGQLYYTGEKLQKNYRTAFEWFMKAAESGHVAAQRMVAEMYVSGKKIGKDKKAAFYWMQCAAMQGDIVACERLAGMYLSGYGCIEDKVKAIELYMKAAMANNSDAQYHLGMINLSSDIILAKDWLNKASSANHPSALYELGRLALKDKDIDKAEYLFKKLYMLGADPIVLGREFLSESILDKAEQWFEIAAQEDKWTIPFIANDYESAGLCEKNFEWRLRAAQTGDTNSQYSVGKMYEWGKGIDMDVEKARYWYQLAAEKDHIKAVDALHNMDKYQKRANNALSFIDRPQENEPEDDLIRTVPKECRQTIKTQLDNLLLEIKRQLKDSFDKKNPLDVFRIKRGGCHTTIYLDELYETQEVVMEVDVINYILLSELTFPKDSDMMTHACLNEAFRLLQTWETEELPGWVLSMYLSYYRRRGECYQKGKEWDKAAKAYKEAMQIIGDHYVNVEYNIPEELDENESEELEIRIGHNVSEWTSVYYELEKELLHCLLNGEDYGALILYFDKIGESVIEGFSEEGDYNFYPYWTSGQYALVEEAYKVILPVLEKVNRSHPWMHHHYSLYLKQTRRFALAEREDMKVNTMGG